MTLNERQETIHNLPVYRLYSAITYAVMGIGLVSAMSLANCASDLLAGTSLGAFMGLHLNEKMSLGILSMTMIICMLIVISRSMYFALKEKSLIPVL